MARISYLFALIPFLVTTPQLNANGKSTTDDTAYEWFLFGEYYSYVTYTLDPQNTYAQAAYYYSTQARLYMYYATLLDLYTESIYQDDTLAFAEYSYSLSYYAAIFQYYSIVTASNANAAAYGNYAYFFLYWGGVIAYEKSQGY